jgi:hypothetical protein
MTKIQQQEYDFKFRKKPLFNVNGLLSMSSVFVLAITLYMTMALIIINNPDLIEYKSTAETALSSIQPIVTFLSIVIMSYTLSALIQYIWRYFSEYWWRKKNHIKVYRHKFWNKILRKKNGR